MVVRHGGMTQWYDMVVQHGGMTCLPDAADQYILVRLISISVVR